LIKSTKSVTRPVTPTPTMTLMLLLAWPAFLGLQSANKLPTESKLQDVAATLDSPWMRVVYIAEDHAQELNTSIWIQDLVYLAQDLHWLAMNSEFWLASEDIH
jgi:hypothetical protein